jgi:hypothetical protein
VSGKRHIAMGDPQAPFTTVLEVLDRAHLLSEGGTLKPFVQLVSIGDHFDWGSIADRARATADGIALVSWLTAHPPEQVVIIAGNHDLARLCELARFADDAAFVAARAQADLAYRRGDVDLALQARFLEDWPFVADAEAIARDYACFSTQQRRLVELAVREGRFRAAHAHRGRLLVHAGVTGPDLASLSVSDASAEAAAAGLNRCFDEAVAAWTTGPLQLGSMYQPSSPSTGHSRGFFSHRPADPGREGSVASDFEGPARRRYDPRTLPEAFGQIVGHIRDKKCRELMPAWATATAAGDGPLRCLTVDGEVVSYRAGLEPGARLTFIDGGMLHTTPERYQLLDLDAFTPLRSG